MHEPTYRRKALHNGPKIRIFVKLIPQHLLDISTCGFHCWIDLFISVHFPPPRDRWRPLIGGWCSSARRQSLVWASTVPTSDAEELYRRMSAVPDISCTAGRCIVCPWGDRHQVTHPLQCPALMGRRLLRLRTILPSRRRSVKTEMWRSWRPPYGPSRAVRLHRVSGQIEHRTTGLLSKRRVRLACWFLCYVYDNIFVTIKTVILW